MGRYTTLTSFLSQWAPSSKADGPTNLALTHCPVLLFEHTADAQVTPPMNELWVAAGGSRLTHHVLKGANHYLAGQPELLRETVETASAWVARL
jgi:alpha/beta superfamily hydrolase